MSRCIKCQEITAELLTLAFPPYNFGVLIWIGFNSMLVAQYRLLPTKRSSLASAVAIGGWLGAFLIPIFGGKSFYMAVLPLAIGFIVFLVGNTRRANTCSCYTGSADHRLAGDVTGL